MTFLALALVLVVLYIASWRASGSPINGVAPAIWQMILLEILPAWAFLTTRHEAVPAHTKITVLVLYLAYGAALCTGFSYAIRNPPHRYLALHRLSRHRSAAIALGLGTYVAYIIRRTTTILHVSPFTRAFYAETRLGWGGSLYTAEAAASLMLILGLAAFKGWRRASLCACSILLLAAFGSKGPPVSAVAIVIFYFVLRTRRFRLGRSTVGAIALAGALYAAFWLYSPSHRTRIGEFFITYSDITRNLMVEINGWDRFAGGALTLQENLYDLVPRSLAPSKPEYFGQRLLAGYFYPRWVENNKGDPSFGRFGLTWADFGALSFGLVPLFAAIQGYWLGRLESRLRARFAIAEFIAYLALAGLMIFAPGSQSIAVLCANVGAGLALEIAVRRRSAPTRRPPVLA